MKVFVVKNTKQVITHKSVKPADIRRDKINKYREYTKQLYYDALEIAMKKGIELPAQTTKHKKKSKKSKRKQERKRNFEGFYDSREWQIQRQRILIRDNYTCQECKSKENLQVHHVKYLIFSNKDEDCITLCKFCHAKKHPINGSKILNSSTQAKTGC